MKIPVVGFDPSMTAWGVAEATLDLTTGILSTPKLLVVEPERDDTKQVRKNSKDLKVAEQLARSVLHRARAAKAVFIECPVGSQSARAMCSYGMCVGILGTLLAEDVQLIEVTATEVKQALSGKSTASKKHMTDEAVKLYPEANWPRHKRNGKGFKKGDLTASAEHVADAIGCIHAGVNTPVFRQLLKLYQ